MRLAADFEHLVPRQPLPEGEHDLKVVTPPYLMNPERNVLVVTFEAQVSRELRQVVNPSLDYQIQRDPDRGWNVEPLWQLVHAFGIPFDGAGVETEDFVHRMGRARVEHQFVGDQPIPTPYISQFLIPPGE